MGKRPSDAKYIFLTTIIRARELRLLTSAAAQQMISAGSPQAALHVLEELGWPDAQGVTVTGLDSYLSGYRAAEFAELEEHCPDQQTFTVLRLRYDYHNLKTLIKSEFSGMDSQERSALLSQSGRYSPDTLTRAYNTDTLEALNPALAQAAAEAKAALSGAEDPQMADVILDKAQYAEAETLAKQARNSFLKGYVQLQADSANLRTTVRCRRLGRDSGFLSQVLVPGGKVSAEGILRCCDKDESLTSVFGGLLSAAAAAGDKVCTGGRLTDFEKLCDNAMAQYLQNARSVTYGEAVVLGYLCALESQISAVRMIIAGLSAGLAPATIRERLRDPYV